MDIDRVSGAGAVIWYTLSTRSGVVIANPIKVKLLVSDVTISSNHPNGEKFCTNGDPTFNCA